MSSRIFVGGLPWRVDNDALSEIFAEFGEVTDAHVVLERETGRSRGFGFVTFASADQAAAALAANGREVDGRSIRVDSADERPQGGGRPSGGRGPKRKDHDGPIVQRRGRPPRDPKGRR